MRCAQRFPVAVVGWISIAVAVSSAAWAATRTWTDKSGKYKTNAELVEATADSVVLKLSDGKTKKIPLDKLSAEDQAFVAEHLAAASDDAKKKTTKETSTKPAAKGPEAAAVRKVAQKFFDNLVKDDQTALGETLTAAAKQQLTAGGSPVQSLPQPDTARSVRLGKATIDGEEATLAVKIKIGGANQDVTLHLRRESDNWKIRAASAALPDGGEETKDFEGTGTATATAEGETPGVPVSGVPEPGVPAPGEPAPSEPAADGGLTVPEGDAQALLKFISDLQKDPRLTQDQAFHKQALLAMIAAADKIFALEGVTKTQLTAAASYKLQVLPMLVGSDVPDVNEQIDALRAQIKQHELTDLERPLEALSLRMELQTAATPAAATAALKKIEQFLASGKIGPAEASLASAVAQVVEYSGLKPADASKAVEALAAPLVASKNAEFEAIGNQLLGKARRLGLVGNSMELRGLTWDSQPLDMSQFQGKVVLVDFWATWCGPCMEEMPNIRKNYDKYHEQGFDVIAISIDQDLKALREYVEREQVPWTVVADNHEEASRSDNMSSYYGVNSIPSTILIGRDGKVVALNVRGEQLEQQLEKLIGSGG